jgi:hypothetical protein
MESEKHLVNDAILKAKARTIKHIIDRLENTQFAISVLLAYRELKKQGCSCLDGCGQTFSVSNTKRTEKHKLTYSSFSGMPRLGREFVRTRLGKVGPPEIYPGPHPVHLRVLLLS